MPTQAFPATAGGTDITVSCGVASSPATPAAIHGLVACAVAASPATPATIIDIERTVVDADYDAWLAGNYSRCLLVEAKCWHGGAEIVRYFSNLPYMSGQGDIPANQPYDDILASPPSISWSIDQPLTANDFEVWNRDGSLDSWLSDGWDGRHIRFYLGDPTWGRADFRLIFVGVLDGISSASYDRVAFKLRDKMERLNKPVQANLVASGPAANTPVPLSYGQCFNVEPVLLDGSTYKFKVHDGAIQAVSQVRSNGSVIGAVTVDATHGEFTLSSKPAGQVTADVWGVGGGGTSGMTTATAAYVSGLAWSATNGPVAAILDVRYAGASVAHTDDLSTGRFTLSASLFTVVADVKQLWGPSTLTGTCAGGATFGFPRGLLYGDAYAHAIGDVKIGATAATATVDLAACSATLAHPLPLAVEFLMYNRYDAPEDSSAYWLTATHVSGSTYRCPLNYGGQYVAQVRVGGTVLTDLAIPVPPGPDPAQTDVDLNDLTGLAVTASVTRFQQMLDNGMAHVSGLTWHRPSAVLEFTDVRLDGVSVGYVPDAGSANVTLISPPGPVEVDFTVHAIAAADIVEALAARPGLLTADDLDSDSFDAFAAALPAPVGWHCSNERRNAIDAITEVLAAVGAQRHFTRLGLLRLWRLDAPTGVAVAEFDADDVVRDSLRLVRVDLPVQRVRVTAKRNWTRQDVAGMAGGVVDNSRYAQEYLAGPAVAFNDVLAAHPNALDPDVIVSIFSSQLDAMDEAARRAALASVARYVFEVDLYARAIGRELGEEIRLTHPRHGFAGGRNAIVVGIDERPTLGRVTLTLWL